MAAKAKTDPLWYPLVTAIGRFVGVMAPCVNFSCRDLDSFRFSVRTSRTRLKSFVIDASLDCRDTTTPLECDTFKILKYFFHIALFVIFDSTLQKTDDENFVANKTNKNEIILKNQ